MAAAAAAYGLGRGPALRAPPAGVLAPQSGVRWLSSSSLSTSGDATHEAAAWREVVVEGRRRESVGALARRVDAHLIATGWTDQGTVGCAQQRVGCAYGLTDAWLPGQRICGSFQDDPGGATLETQLAKAAIRDGRPVLDITLEYEPDSTWCGYAQFMHSR